ncbi:MAG: hypothetical protein ACRCTZ_03720 [Sarcina sp.]
MSKKFVSILNLIGFVFLIVASFIFSRKGSNFNTEQIDPIFMPSGYAFSIWILIYILLGIWVLKAFFCKGNICDMYNKATKWVLPCFILTGVTVLVPTKISNIFISFALATAILSYFEIYKSKVSKIYKIPFSLLLGWLYVATIVDHLLVLKLNGWFNILNINEITLAIVMLGVGAFIAIIFAVATRDNIILGVIIWAYIAIVIKNSEIRSILIMAIGMCSIIIIAMIYNLFNKKNNK